MTAVRWAPQWTVREVAGEALYLLSESEAVVLEQPAVRALHRAIDGVRDEDEVVDAAAEEDPALDLADLYFLIEELIAKGYLRRGTSDRTVALLAEWGASLPDPLPTVAVLALGADTADADALRSVLELPTADDPDLLVVVADDYLNPGLADIDRRRRASGKPWVLARNTRAHAWVGPLFQPGHTACWHCLAHRIRGNRDVEEYLRLRTHAGDAVIRPQGAGPAVTSALAAGLIGTEVLKAVVGLAEPGVLHTYEVVSMQHDEHPVVRRPQCPSCGTPATAEEHPPMQLHRAGHPAANESGYRSVEPSVTLQRYEQHISPITGAVTQLTRIKVDDPSLHVYAAGHNFAMRGSDLRYLRAGLRTKSSGKGITEEQAKVSALGEALERYQGLYTGEEARRRTSLTELGDLGIPPNDVMLWSDRQYQHRDEWNARDNKFAIIPEPFPDDYVCDFSPVWSLTQQRTKYLPTGMLYYAVPRPDSHMFFIACSNGAAAGNTMEEAVLQGMLELVERDAVAVWWYHRLRRPEVDLDSFDDPQLSAIRRSFEKLGRPIRVLDLTHDLGIPVYAAVSARLAGVSEDILLGFGAHLDPRIAALRAVSEVTQFYPAVAPHAADGSGYYDYDDAESQDWWQTATRVTDPYLVPDPAAKPVDPAVGPTADMAEAIAAVRSRIESAGHEVLVLDQTRPDIGFPTVKVIAPGLRHFWARYREGRLYDVPVSLGWQDAPAGEGELNPRVMFL